MLTRPVDRCVQRGYLRGTQLEILLRRHRLHAGSGSAPSADVHRSSRRHLSAYLAIFGDISVTKCRLILVSMHSCIRTVLLPSEHNRRHKDPHLPAERSL